MGKEPPQGKDGEPTKLKERIVQVEQLFPLFPEGSTKKVTVPNFNFPEYSSSVTLELEDGQRLTFVSQAEEHGNPHSIPGFSPFHTHTGYRINSLDFDNTAGQYRYKQWLREPDPLEHIDPLEIALVEADPEKESARLSSFKGLRLQIIANGYTCESVPLKRTQLEDPHFMFRNFYPSDSGTGPLPNFSDGGFILRAPNDIHELRKINARFIFREQK